MGSLFLTIGLGNRVLGGWVLTSGKRVWGRGGSPGFTVAQPLIKAKMIQLVHSRLIAKDTFTNPFYKLGNALLWLMQRALFVR